MFMYSLVSGDLEITCSTNVTGDNINGRMIQLFFEANQDATFRCRTNNEAYTTCKEGSFHLYQKNNILYRHKSFYIQKC